MSKPKQTRGNFQQGKATAERETADGWGGPDTSASPLPLDQHHTRRETVGYGEFPPDVRRQPALAGSELARIVTDVSPAQLIHGATRGMPGKRDFADGTGRPSGRIKAVIHHDYGLGSLVTRTADEGHDPLSTPIAHDYRRAPKGPRPDQLSKYVDAARHIPVPTGWGSGYPREHEQSAFVTAGDEIIATFEKAGPRSPVVVLRYLFDPGWCAVSW